MKYSLRNLMWSVIVVCLATTLVVKGIESQQYASCASIARADVETRAQLRAFHKELDECLGKGWRFERDASGTLVVKRSGE